MAYNSQARRAQKHHADLPAFPRPGAEPGRERLAVSPSQLDLKHRLRKLRRHCRRRLRRMAETDRQARNHHIHRNAGLGPRRSVAMTFGITPENVALPDLRFTSAFMLSYGGSPMGVLAYVDPSGAPVLLCILANG